MFWYSSALNLDLGKVKIVVINSLEPVPLRRQVEITKVTQTACRTPA